MIIKTTNFDQQLNDDIKNLYINRKNPFFIKGSYKIKPFNSYISDIDFQVSVYYNEGLLNRIYIILNYIKRTNKFFFIHINAGMYTEFKLPWKIDEDGGCKFKLKKTKKWFVDFKNKSLVPDNISKYIEDKLNKNYLRLRDLIDIENVLLPYSQIIWKQEDIRKGYKEVRNNRYILLDIMKTETPVLEFVYHYKDEEQNGFCLIDIGLVDKKYKSEPTQKMYKYYTEDWYKILKTYRWKLKEEEKQEYFDVMKNIELLIALKYQVEMLIKLKYYTILTQDNINIITRNLVKHLKSNGIVYNNDNDAKNELENKINKYLEKYVEYFRIKLKSEYQTEYLLWYNRGLESQIPTTIEELKLRKKRGIECPFFILDWDAYKIVSELSLRILFNVETMIDCFLQVSKEMDKSINEIIETVGKNNLSLNILEKEKIILYDDNNKIGEYLYSEFILKKLQTYVLIFKELN